MRTGPSSLSLCMIHLFMLHRCQFNGPLLSNFIVILMIYFGWRCHTSSEPPHSNLPITVDSVLIFCVTRCVVVGGVVIIFYDTNQMIVNHVAGDDMRSLITQALTYNQVHIDQSYYQFLFWVSRTSKRENIKSLLVPIIIIMVFFCWRLFVSLLSGGAIRPITGERERENCNKSM